MARFLPHDLIIKQRTHLDKCYAINLRSLGGNKNIFFSKKETRTELLNFAFRNSKQEPPTK